MTRPAPGRPGSACGPSPCARPAPAPFLRVTRTRTPVNKVIQELREASPFDAAPRHLIPDRDSILSAEVSSGE
jgi:hypothetical protein